MDEDVIVVDDVETPTQTIHESPPVDVSDVHEPAAPPANAERRPRTSQRILASSSRPGMHRMQDASERHTRSATAKPKPQPKLKLKLSEKAAAQAPGMSFLGAYDRELDSDEEDLAFEEQFILRMPPGEDCEKLRKMVAGREVSNDVWFKFKDSRRAVFHIGNSTYSAKLVDLPCIIESQKTLDNKQMFKVADICQMLVVGDRAENDEGIATQKGFNIDEFIWPHGITPPLHHVRKRRFRKRVNRRTIESAEQEVERLLEEDAAATQVQYVVLENVNPDLSDSEFIEHDEPLDAPTPAIGSDVGDVPTPGADFGDGDAEDEDEESAAEGDIDEDLAAELNMALEEEADDEEDEEEEEEDTEEDDDDDDDEVVQARKLLNEEIRDLEAAVAKKGHEIAASVNPLIKKRFEDALKKLTADLEMKLAQRDEMKEQQRMKKEGIVPEDVDTDPEGPTREGEVEIEELDPFGDPTV